MSLLGFFLHSLWCAGKLGNCPSKGLRFRFCCLYCRWRREVYRRLTAPPYWIKYVYKSIPPRTILVDSWEHQGVRYFSLEGKKLRVTKSFHVWIDPRGRFTGLRCAAIRVFDCFIGWMPQGRTKPWVEFCELLANYPTW